ncbi:CYTH and CHAD domain-containing protein [Bordetella sp. FB-8]|uniref:CYTH and CHAD domain-containing protein n=1 Tax=Bordetella sp. FB-8 TaxID=1159870 RepID=UPI00039F5D5B|nr:CYTH and CHAD domain-containing protein [Bordetella sp. FB-8]
MSEQELKLHVSPAHAAAIRRELLDHGARRITLRALYFDTPERELARARIALRLRLEGRRWMQTLKTPGADAITRVELNHPRPDPTLDLSVYAGTPFEAVLSKLRGPLGPRYETDVRRLVRTVRSRQGTVELAFDTGLLRAGALELPICELEFELMSGRPAAIFTVARGWRQRHALLLDTRSKSERGDALATLAQQLEAADSDQTRTKRVAGFWAPRGAAGVALRPAMPAPAAMAAVAAECIEQITRNAAVLAEVDTLGVYPAGNSEHVHQLRVGMRRLRSAWSLFEGWIEPPPDALVEGLRAHFAALGANRDQDVLEETIAPMLLKAGMPVIPTQSNGDPQNDSQAIAAGKPFQAWLSDLLEWSLNVRAPAPAAAAETAATAQGEAQDQTEAAPKPKRLAKRLAKRLHGWHAKVVEQGLRFGELHLEERHALRKRGKRLRYSLAFAESLLPASRLNVYRKQLSLVQDVLGEINDLAVARDYYRVQCETHPQAWFALGWIEARLAALSAQAQQAFKELANTKPFWN